MKPVLQKIATAILTLLVCLAIGEAALRMFTPFPVSGNRHKAAHPSLGYTFEPSLADIDEHGFRNPPGAWDQPDIAVIGDSHAYGYNVEWKDSFPAKLAPATGRGVYSFGIGSYGIYQYKVLLDDAREMGFKDVVVALFPSNDVAPTCSSTENDYWRNYARENDITIAPCYGSPYPTGLRRYARIVSDAIKRSATVDAIKVLAWNRIRDRLAAERQIGAEDYFMFSNGLAMKRGTVRELDHAASLDDPGVLQTFENSKRFFAEANKALAERNIGLVFFLVPSKAMVLQAWARDENIPLDPEFTKPMAHLEHLIAEYKRFFDDNGIVYVDGLPHMLAAFRRSLAEGWELYPISDGHPYAQGYQAYVDAAVEGLRALEH